jgi:tripartite-type tricarboxylate transporter receptor subunit TctC
MKRRSSFALIPVFLLSAILAVAPAAGQRLSDRTIFIVVPFTPGTGIDVLARIIGEELRQRWNQAVVMENKPGASGNMARRLPRAPSPTGTPS